MCIRTSGEKKSKGRTKMKTKFWEWRKSLSADVMKNAEVHRGVLVCDCPL